MTVARTRRGCAVCRGPMPPPKRMGRPRVYCSDACRIRSQKTGIDRTYANLRGPRWAIGGDEVDEMWRRRNEGWSREQLAAVYGVSTRTIDRYLSRSRPMRIEIGMWQAWFTTSVNGRPTQISAWELVPAHRIERAS